MDATLKALMERDEARALARGFYEQMRFSSARSRELMSHYPWLARDGDTAAWVDPEGCGCTDCLTGESRPARDLADVADAMARGRYRG